MLKNFNQFAKWVILKIKLKNDYKSKVNGNITLNLKSKIFKNLIFISYFATFYGINILYF